MVTVPEGEQVACVREEYKSHSIILSDIRELWTLETFTCMTKQGADIHAGGDWALRWAAINGHSDIVKYLVEKGADIHAMNE